MTYYRMLEEAVFEPEHLQVVGSVFEDVCSELGLAKRDDLLRDIVAKAIIDCARAGERDVASLRKCAHEALQMA